ncbi:MAG: class I SAM-dependent methyltransferase [Candidatus Riflebacteria bacterium]|nr:class I SAM-dependent methyltransferase [Candidatus Riflebacteria bacterium]
MNLEAEKRFFDSFNSKHGDYDVLSEKSYERIISTFMKAVKPNSAMKCVDLGCGTGAFTRRLSKQGFVMTGVDISSTNISRAKSAGTENYYIADIRNCHLPDSSFDFAVMSGVLHHFPDRKNRITCLKEAWRLLKDDGIFFSYDPNGNSPSMFLFRDPRSPLYSSEGKTENEVLLTKRQMMSEIRKCGFADIEVFGLSGIAFRFVEGKIAQKLLPLYNNLYEPLLQWSGFEKYFGTFLISVARKLAWE